MRCPFCDKEMEYGLLQSGSMIVWVKKKHPISLLPKAGDVLLKRDPLGSCTLPTWICKQCRRVIAEYPEKEETEF